ncbi:MAG: peptidoglycan-associated lipoprotein Pal [Moraxellaceae bacterium]|nr:peptidoglycan-associated lipoprotein Pal [Moraxellaceae bacterium]MDZ4387623.1 peptidoglycan-associated lipoprotein Pal [Moraxellaceae bacterium]
MNIALKYTTLGLLAVSLSGCALFQKKTTEAPPQESGPLAPVIGGGAIGAEINAAGIRVCSDADRNALFATLGSEAGALETRVFYFDTDASNLKPETEGALMTHAKLLSKVGVARVQLTGHTDERGTQDYNLALGERRANAVARYFSAAGVKAEQMNVVSYGKERPVADGSNESAWQQNRRVELDYTVCR